MTDFLVDSDTIIRWVPNPVMSAGSDDGGGGGIARNGSAAVADRSYTVPQKRRVGVHSGFYSYLNGTKRRGLNIGVGGVGIGVTKPNSAKSKFERVREHLKSLVREYPDYKVLVVGHSLGGALATLCALQLASASSTCSPSATVAAAAGDVGGNENGVKNNHEGTAATTATTTTTGAIIPVPITCISFASPRVGNIQFFRAFQELEMRGRIRHFRVANARDVITMLPDGLSCLSGVFCQDRIYRHVGIMLKLFPDSNGKKRRRCSHEIIFPRVHHSTIGVLLGDLSVSARHVFEKWVRIPVGLFVEDYFTYHSCEEYLNRLSRTYEELREVTLNELYAQYRGIVEELKRENEENALPQRPGVLEVPSSPALRSR